MLWNRGTLKNVWEKFNKKVSTKRRFTGIKLSFAEQGIDREFVGRFCWGVIDELISSFGIVSLKQVRECTNSFGHIALSRGSLGATIYGISRGGNSRIYKAELDRTQLFPKLRWWWDNRIGKWVRFSISNAGAKIRTCASTAHKWLRPLSTPNSSRKRKCGRQDFRGCYELFEPAQALSY